MLRGSEHTMIRRPVEPPVDLDAGRLDVVRAALAGAFVLGCVLVAALGAWALLSAIEHNNRLGSIVAGAVVLVCLVFGGVVLWLSVLEWVRHQDRLSAWHDAALAAYSDAGAETIETVSEWELSIDNPGHVIVAALDVMLRLRDGSEMPYSVRELRGPIMWSGRRVGSLSKIGAESMSRRFADLGLVAGRREGFAGAWVPRSADEVLDLVLRNWR